MQNVVIGGEAMIKFSKIKKVRESIKLGLGVLVALLGVYALVYHLSTWILEVFLIFLSVVVFREAIVLGFKENKVRFLVSLCLFFFGAFPIGLEFGVFDFLPLVMDMAVDSYVLSSLVIVFGLFVIVNNALDLLGWDI